MNFRMRMQMQNFVSMHISHISKKIMKFRTCLLLVPAEKMQVVEREKTNLAAKI